MLGIGQEGKCCYTQRGTDMRSWLIYSYMTYGSQSKGLAERTCQGSIAISMLWHAGGRVH